MYAYLNAASPVVIRHTVACQRRNAVLRAVEVAKLALDRAKIAFAEKVVYPPDGGIGQQQPGYRTARTARDAAKHALAIAKANLLEATIDRDDAWAEVEAASLAEREASMGNARANPLDLDRMFGTKR